MNNLSQISNINETFIIEPVFMTGNSTTWSACTSLYTNMVVSCSSTAYMTLADGSFQIQGHLTPVITDTYNLGSPIFRFRAINTLSGSSTVWNSTSINTNSINLGLDSFGNPRVITADTIILNQDIVDSGRF